MKVSVLQAVETQAEDFFVKGAAACSMCEMDSEENMNELSDSITCDDSIKRILTQNTINVCNQIVLGMKEDDHGLVEQVSSDQGLHAALGLPDVPAGLRQGADPVKLE